MKKVYVLLIAFVLVFGGCVRSSTLKRAVVEGETARLRAEVTEKTNKSNLEEIASIKKDLKELRARNEGLVEGNIKKAGQIASLESVVQGKAKENEDLRKKLDALDPSGLTGNGATEINTVGSDVYGELFKALKEDIDMGSLSIMRGAETLSLLLKEKALFDIDNAGLLPEGKALLQRISSASENLNFKGSQIQIRPILPHLKVKNVKTGTNLALRRGAVITRFLNERADVKKAAQHGLPYKESAITKITGYVAEVLFPSNE